MYQTQVKNESWEAYRSNLGEEGKLTESADYIKWTDEIQEVPYEQVVEHDMPTMDNSFPFSTSLNVRHLRHQQKTYLLN